MQSQKLLIFNREMAKPYTIEYSAEYGIKFKNLIEICEGSEAFGVAVNSPQALGDTYEEVMESLHRLSDAGLSLHIIPSRIEMKDAKIVADKTAYCSFDLGDEKNNKEFISSQIDEVYTISVKNDPPEKLVLAIDLIASQTQIVNDETEEMAKYILGYIDSKYKVGNRFVGITDDIDKRPLNDTLILKKPPILENYNRYYGIVE